mmetsp:Transcript_39627/g.117912  ORF Transcript_39627/g.117912 Transcript_39627/m.117912 type:complete len:244 (-) Transcript_39627:443-1174(-)
MRGPQQARLAALSFLIVICVLSYCTLVKAADWGSRRDRADAAVGKIPAQLGADPEPVWPTLFSIEFNESSIILFKRTTTGKWWYDAANRIEVVHREDGRGDQYCGSIHSLDVTPCTQIVTGGFRYIVFPEHDECCRCCGDDQGCGVIDARWLSGGDVHYQTTEVRNGVRAYKWVKEGVKNIYYWATADARQVPVEIDKALWPKIETVFDPSTYVEGQPIDPELLKLPDNCDDKCPIKSICTLP